MSEKLLNTIERIYSAPGSSRGWINSVKSINYLVGGKASAYFLVNRQTMENEINAIHGFREIDKSRYEGALGASKDIRFQYLHNLTPGEVFREFEFVPDRKAYNESEWIKYQYKSLGVYWCMSAQISKHGLWRDYISINRLKELGSFTDEQKNNLSCLLPHLSRAAELHRTLTCLERKYGAVLSVLDMLLVGLVILNHKKQVTVCNETAREIIQDSGSVKITGDGRFIACNNEENILLQGMITKSINTALAEGLYDGGQMHIRSDKNSILAEIIPMRDDGLSDRENIKGVAVFLMNPKLSKVITLNGIAKIFSLTKSEISVAESVANGLNLRDIADNRNTAIETVRKQIKSVFQKTGANSQIELLRLATKATPPIKPR
ncbi:MAG: helix-turn-helix transcriptional regulator [Candidatus Thiodiazotropha endolucinida]